jgi:hypothetical protein
VPGKQKRVREGEGNRERKKKIGSEREERKERKK